MRALSALLVVWSASLGSIGMSAALNPIRGECHVVAGTKLAAPIDGKAICSEVERAIAADAPNIHYKAEIRVLSPSRLAATLIVEGQTLPVQNFAVMDRNLSEGTIKRFAQSLAAVIAAAAKT